eukprot:3265162-Rhodomonas_salina.1
MEKSQMEVWDLMRPLSEGRWWAWAALGELTRDFEQASKRLADLIFNEIGLENRMKLLPPDQDGVYRAYTIEIVLTPHDKLMFNQRSLIGKDTGPPKGGAEDDRRNAVGTSSLAQQTDAIHCQGARCMARSAPPKVFKVVFGPGARNVSFLPTLKVRRSHGVDFTFQSRSQKVQQQWKLQELARA